MRRPDWDLLGLTPTADAAAIRRAYAARLKRTRPDDDAQAYQRLREAYDAALAWARLASAAPDPPAASTDPAPAAAGPADPQPAEAPVEAATASAPAATPPPGLDTPEALFNAAMHAWQQGGAAAVLAAWPLLRAALHRLPLHQGAEASARFADLVIGVPQLPAPFIAGLQAHFEWLGDYRTARTIGSARANALQEALAGRVVQPLHDPDVWQAHAELLGLHRLLQAGRWLRAQAYATLTGVAIEQRVIDSGAALLLRLGVDTAALQRLRSALSRGQWLRLLALLVCVSGVAAVGGATVEQIAIGLVVTLLGAALLGMCLLGLLLHLLRLRNAAALPWRWRQRLRLQIGPHTGTRLGLLALLLSALCWPVEGVPALLTGLLLAALGVLLALPRRLDHALVLCCLGLLSTASFLTLWHGPVTAAVTASLCGAWALAGGHAQALGWRVPGWMPEAAQPWQRRVGGVLMAVPGLPLASLQAADAFGFRLVLGGCWCQLAWVSMQTVSGHPLARALGLLATWLVLARLQQLARRLAQRLRPD